MTYSLKHRAMQIALNQKSAEITAKADAHEQKVARILSVPEIKLAHEEYLKAMFDNAIGGKGANEEKAKAKYVAALTAHGFDENDMQPSPICPVCNDTGRVSGRTCKCVWAKYIPALKAICEIEKRAPFAFEDANFEVAKDEKQRETLEKLFEFGKAWATKLPAVKSTNLLFFGNAGTGKTYLSSAIARAVVERGKSVKYVSAYEFNSVMLAVHTSPLAEREDKLADYLTSDLLVIDDLGTEPILKNVTLEYLLLTLEERTSKGLNTLISTNLSPARLLDRYGERIYSRLACRQNSRILEFGGKDLRL